MKKVAKKVAKKATKAAAKKVAAPQAVPTKAVVDPVPAKKAAKKVAKKAAAPTKETAIVANVDVGFGNSLFLRGDGPGLSWSKGVPMDCLADDTWSVSMSGVTEAFEFKVLINDTYWSSGYNMIAQPGSSIEFDPDF